MSVKTCTFDERDEFDFSTVTIRQVLIHVIYMQNLVY